MENTTEPATEAATGMQQAVASAAELNAWILPIAKGISVAIGQHELKYIEYISATVTLPGLPAYCEQGFQWRDHFIPALDLQSLVERRRNPAPSGEQLAAIIAYENVRGQLAFGAIFLQGVPSLLPVTPQQSAPLTDLSSAWRLLAHAAFNDQGSVYAVLDLRCLFDKNPVDLLSLH
jgi:chemotaxis signal transduction protein